MRVLVLLVALVGWTYVADAKKLGYVDASVVDVKVSGGALLVTCHKGTEAGIGKDWTAKLLSGGREIASATLIRFTSKTSVLKVDITFDQIPKELGCRLFPPS